MFCKSCGNKIDNDSIFCSFCGTKQSEKNKPQNDNVKNSFLKNESSPTSPELSFQKQIQLTSTDVLDDYNEPKYDLTYKKENEATIAGCILLIVSIIITIFQPFKFETTDSYNQFRIFTSIASLILRILITIWVKGIAKRQNRELFGWGIFAFFFPSIALIIIGLQKKLFQKFEISKSLNKEQNSQLLCEKAIEFLNNKKYNECIRFAEKAIEFDPSNNLATKTLIKARLDVPINEISNKHTQIVYRETKDNIILKIISKNYQSIGAEVFIENDIAHDGEYSYLKDGRKLIIKDGKIDKILT